MAGDRDGVIRMNPRGVSELKTHVPNLKGTVMLPGAGHWTQQERPEAVNAALIGFFKGQLFG
jgi:pimeloyl-ACP methyl ester carboxylesterase